MPAMACFCRALAPGLPLLKLSPVLSYPYPKGGDRLRSWNNEAGPSTKMRIVIPSTRRYLGGLLDVSPIQAGLNAAGFVRDGMASRQAEAVAENHGIEAPGLHRFTLGRRHVQGLLLGLAIRRA
jgi:hypothetical protein